jgi:hypothetical protein
MSVCDFNGRYDIGTDIVRGNMSVECFYPATSMSLDESMGLGDMLLELSPISATFPLELVYPISGFDMCIPAVDRVIAIWYVYPNYTVTIGGKTFGYVYFK